MLGQRVWREAEGKTVAMELGLPLRESSRLASKARRKQTTIEGAGLAATARRDGASGGALGETARLATPLLDVPEGVHTFLCLSDGIAKHERLTTI